MAENSEHPRADQVPIEWGFWLLWVLASTAGLGMGWSAGTIVSLTVSVEGDIAALAVASAGWAAGGALMGATQWLVLRKQMSRAGWWVLASSPSFGLGMVGGTRVAVVLSGVLSGVLIWAVWWGLWGAMLGAAQWLVLRRRVSRAGYWVLASTVGAGTCGAVLGALYQAGIEGASFFLGSALFGAITGAALVRLLQRPLVPRSEPAASSTGVDPGREPGAL